MIFQTIKVGDLVRYHPTSGAPTLVRAEHVGPREIKIKVQGQIRYFYRQTGHAMGNDVMGLTDFISPATASSEQTHS